MNRPPAADYRTDLAWIHHTGFSEFSESAAPGIIAILSRMGIDGGMVVDAGCGSGVLARRLTESGFHVTGFDASPEMIAIARLTAPAAQFRVERLDSAELPHCDVITAVGEVLNYGSLDQVRQFIHNAGTALRPGGVLLFDIAESNACQHDEERRVGGDDWSVIAIKSREGNHLLRKILTFRMIEDEIRRDEELHVLELYDRKTILSMTRAAGFRPHVRRSYGTRRLPPGHAVYVCQRK
jgi:SAM-dependent methyltransferase